MNSKARKMCNKHTEQQLQNNGLQKEQQRSQKQKSVNQIIIDSFIQKLKQQKDVSNKKIKNLISFNQQIEQFVSYSKNPLTRKIILVPISNSSYRPGKNQSKYQKSNQFIQIFNIRDNQTKLRHRIIRKRSSARSNKVGNNSTGNAALNSRSNTAVNLSTNLQQQQQNDSSFKNEKLLFIANDSICLNVLLHAMATRDKLWVGFGTNSQQLQQDKHKQTYAKGIVSEIQQQQMCGIFEQIQAYPKIINKQRPFTNLASLVFQVNQESLSLGEFISSIKIIEKLLKYIRHENMRNLQKLEVKIWGNPLSRYRNHMANEEQSDEDSSVSPEHQIDLKNTKHFYEDYAIASYEHEQARCVLNSIYDSLHSILKSKLSKNQESGGYFPKLAQFSCNPSFLVKSCLINQPKHQNFNGEQQKVTLHNDYDANLEYELIPRNHDLNTWVPITKLTLVQLSSQINDSGVLKQIIQKIMIFFPKLTNLALIFQISSKDYSQKNFTKFNQLCSQLHKYCRLLQCLKIEHCCPNTNKQSGLRDILKYYPYLFELKIEAPNGTGNAANNEQLQNRKRRQWEYIKEIHWRRLHIQRLINMIKIMQKKGYNTDQCMGVLPFMQPLNLASTL